MSTSPGITIDRGIRILRLGLWVGAGINIASGIAVIAITAPWIVPRSMERQALQLYAGWAAIVLTALGAIAVVAAYAPYGNRRLIRVIVLTHLALFAWARVACSDALCSTEAIHAVIAVTIYIGLRLARL